MNLKHFIRVVAWNGLVLILSLTMVFVADVFFTKAFVWQKDLRAYIAKLQHRTPPGADLVHIASKVYHHDLAPMFSGKTNFGPIEYTLTTNSLGFKDSASRQIPLIPSRPRILFMGDSFTEGVGLPYKETFVGLIDAQWQKQYDVLNGALSSYSPIIYYRKIKYLLETTKLKVDQVVVFIDISDIQDEILYKFDADENVIYATTERYQINHMNDEPWITFLGAHTTLTRRLAQWVRDLIEGEHSDSRYIFGVGRGPTTL